MGVKQSRSTTPAFSHRATSPRAGNEPGETVGIDGKVTTTRQSIDGPSVRSSSGPFTTPTPDVAACAALTVGVVMASNLSFGSGSANIESSTGSPGPHQQPLAGPGTSPGIWPVMRDDQRRRRPRCLGFLLPFGRQRWLLGPSCSRRRAGPSSRSAYRADDPDPDGDSTFHMHETRPGWVPPLHRDGGVPTAGQMPPAAACRFSAASPAPRCRIPPTGLTLTMRHQGFTHVHPSGLLLTCTRFRAFRGARE